MRKDPEPCCRPPAAPPATPIDPSDVAVNALKSTFAASTAAFDQFQKATKQVVDLADASVRAATESAVKTAANVNGKSKRAS